MARVYATAEQLAAYKPGGDTVPAEDADALLAVASKLIDQALVARAYDVDANGLPTDTDDAAGMRDATCATAVELYTRGALESGGTDVWDSVSIGSVSLSGRATDGNTDVFGLPVPPVAAVYLSDVGVPSVSVR
jgi:hypothetical protein